MLKPIVLDSEFIGKKLPWDIYAENGVLLGRAGTIISDEQQFFTLTQKNIFIRTKISETNNPLRSLIELAEDIEKILATPEPAALASSAERLLELLEDDPDACLGYVLRAPVACHSVRHCIHVALVSFVLAQALDFERRDLINLVGAALSMNLADLDLHDAMWGRRSPVGPKERAQLYSHPLRAATQLSALGVDADWVRNVREHHENIDGTGYPNKLTLKEISFGARILRVADVYCAKVSGRYYRPPRSPRHALLDVFGSERRHLDPMITNVLLRRFGIYPPGTLVRLANNEKACVTRRVLDGRLRRVVSFLDARDHLLESPQERDVTRRATAVRGFVKPDRRWPAIAWASLWGY